MAFFVGVALVKLGRKALGKVVEDVFARGDVDRKIAPFGGGDSARRRSIRLSPVETSCTTDASPSSKSWVMDLISVGVFIAVIR